MPTTRDELVRTLTPPVLAVALLLIFFTIFDRWNKLGDPLNSIAAVLFAAIGFAVAATLDRVRARRNKQPDAGDDAPAT